MAIFDPCGTRQVLELAGALPCCLAQGSALQPGLTQEAPALLARG